MRDDETHVRHAEAADAAAEHAVFCASVGELYRARNYQWTEPRLEDFARNRAHILATDPLRCWVAELRGRVVGYTRAIVRHGTWFFASLFVDPAAQGRGIGRRLFDLAVADAPSRRMTITDSIQPISNALYGTRGLLSIATLIRLVGTARSSYPAGLEPAEASIDDLARIDRAAYGFERRIDHPYWASRWTRHAWARGGEIVGWSYRWPNGNIGPLAAVDADVAAEVFRAEVALDPSASIEMPASARPMLFAALTGGLRIVPPMGLLLASDGVPAPTALAISNYGLY